MPSRASKNTTDISFAIAFVNVLYCRYLGLSIQKRVTALQASGCQLSPLFNTLLHRVFLFCSLVTCDNKQAIDPIAASSGLIVDTFRCDDYQTSATLLVNAAIALNITTLVLTKDDMHM